MCLSKCRSAVCVASLELVQLSIRNLSAVNQTDSGNADAAVLPVVNCVLRLHLREARGGIFVLASCHVVPCNKSGSATLGPGTLMWRLSSVQMDREQHRPYDAKILDWLASSCHRKWSFAGCLHLLPRAAALNGVWWALLVKFWISEY